MSSIGNRLVHLRKNKGLNQSEAAKQIGISKANLSRYESNKRTPSKVTLEKLATFYNVRAGYIMFGDSHNKTNRNKQLSFLEDITEEEARLLEEYLKKIRDEQ